MTTLDASLLLQAAANAAADQDYPTATLYVVATPIGNRADLGLRALHVLGLVDAIACEDTRHSAPLLRQFGIDKPTVALHRHNEHEASAGVLARLARGERVAYVSDAGTPAISDPGSVLVAAVQAAGYRTLPVPGSSSVIAALSVAGDAHGSAFTFYGFVPARGGERGRSLELIAASQITGVLFEAPHRIAALAAELAQRCPARKITLCRELTKQFETVATLLGADLPAWLEADPNRQRGEFVIVVHASEAATPAGEAAHDSTLRTLLAVLPLKQAVAVACELTGAPRNALYARALTLKQAAG